jgi:hypothetical protein
MPQYASSPLPKTSSGRLIAAYSLAGDAIPISPAPNFLRAEGDASGHGGQVNLIRHHAVAENP